VVSSWVLKKTFSVAEPEKLESEQLTFYVKCSIFQLPPGILPEKLRDPGTKLGALGYWANVKFFPWRS
jgi:hypothetical protein